MKTCTQCNDQKNFTEFRRDSSKKDGYQPYCKDCAKASMKIRYGERYQVRTRAQQNNRSRDTRRVISELKERCGCACCSEREPVCLEFHHLDPTQKDFTVARSTSMSRERLLEEIKKCICVCSNCHKKIHAGILTIPALTNVVVV